MSSCNHNWEWHSQTATTVTHKCSKCGATSTQSKPLSRSDVACLLFAVAVFLAALTPIWFAARVTP